MAAPYGFPTMEDAALAPAAFALPAAASTSTSSAAIDLGTGYKPQGVTLVLSVPALNTTMVPDTRTVDYIWESSTVSNFASIARTISSTRQTGAGAAGVGAIVVRSVVPPDCERYVRATVTAGASTTTMAAVSATPSVAF